MNLRSLLFVPGDRPERFAKAVDSGADAIILDLEDSVAPANKAAARNAIAEYLQAERRCAVFVRVNDLESGHLGEDLSAVVPAMPDGIMLPKAEGARTLERFFSLMGNAPVPILPITAETPASLFELGTFSRVAESLIGLTWGAEDLRAAIHARDSRVDDGELIGPLAMARNMTLFAACSANVPAIETVYPEFRDIAGLERFADRARRDGFSGMMAIHPAQVAILNRVFSSTDAEIARARSIVEAFERERDAGVLQIDGQMVDRPHLLHARRLLASL